MVAGNKRIERNDIHCQCLGSLGDFDPDATQSNQTQHLVAHFHAHKLVAIPTPLAHRGICHWNVSRQRQHHGDGVLRRGNGIGRRRVDDQDPLPGSRLQVDIVGSHTGPPNDL